MWYHGPLLVPAGTTEASPVKVEIQLTHGVIIFLGVGFPQGCRQLVKVRIRRALFQVLPINGDEPAAWDNGIEGGTYHYQMFDEPYQLEVYGYAPSATQDHTVTIFVNQLPREIAEANLQSGGILSRLAKLIGI